VIQVNLLPREERASGPRPSFSLPRRGFWLPLALCVAILLPLAGIATMQRVKITSLRSDIAQAENETRKLRPQIERIQALEREQAGINERLVSVMGLVRDRYLPVQVMDQLATSTPDQLWFTKFNQESIGQLTLEGMTFSNLLVAELMTRMEETDIFDSVDLTVAERGKIGDQKVVKFTLSSRIKP
jgi:type IV pilus assembly protein PilN